MLWWNDANSLWIPYTLSWRFIKRYETLGLCTSMPKEAGFRFEIFCMYRSAGGTSRKQQGIIPNLNTKHTGKCKCVIVYTSTYMYVFRHTGMYQYVKVYSSTYVFVQIHTFVQIYSDIYKYIPVYTGNLKYDKVQNSLCQFIAFTKMCINTGIEPGTSCILLSVSCHCATSVKPMVATFDSTMHKLPILPIDTFACLDLCGTHMP